MHPDIRRTQRIRDPVHGLIVFGGSGDGDRDETDRIAWRLLDAPEVQRLRRVRQLGFADLVFPGATHTRFAHSLGVYHMARRLADVVARQHRRDRERERVALLAALLHDAGHGPFSHAFEAAARVGAGGAKRHEEWSAEIAAGDTAVNRILREADASLPERIAALLRGEGAPDIYSAIVSSQFDADRLDYIQRDRLMTGVEFGHIDLDWLLDSLEVAEAPPAPGIAAPAETPCLCLGAKGVQVAEEYLEARFRLYRMVYMHKTSRAADKMLEALLCAAADAPGGAGGAAGPVHAFLAAERPTLGAYLALDDAAVWAALAGWAEGSAGKPAARLARRLRERALYKCVDIGERVRTGDGQTEGGPEDRLFACFRRALEAMPAERRADILLDDASVALYRWYDFDDASASPLDRVLVRAGGGAGEPVDIAGVSDIVQTRRAESRIQRAYAPGAEEAAELERILAGLAG